MKTFRKTSAFLLVIGIVVATFFACSKEKDLVNMPQTDAFVGKIPLAILDHSSGIIQYYINEQEIQSVVNQTTEAKDNDRYVLESYQILDDNEGNDPLIFKYVFIDTELELSISMFLVDFFIDKEICQNQTCYYVKEQIISGSYYFTLQDESGGTFSKVTVNNHTVVSVEDWQGNELLPPQPIYMCLGKNCKSGCDIVDMTETTFNCSKCIPHPDVDDYYCEKRSGVGAGSMVSIINNTIPQL